MCWTMVPLLAGTPYMRGRVSNGSYTAPRPNTSPSYPFHTFICNQEVTSESEPAPSA